MSTATIDERVTTTAPPRTPPRRRSLVKRYPRSRALGWTLVVGLVVLWQWYATARPTPSLPPLSDIVVEWRAEIASGALLDAMSETLRLMGWGYLIAAVSGIVVGVVMGRVRVVYALLEPVLELKRHIPTTALLPLLILYLGLGDAMKVTAIVLSAFFPVVLNAMAGARSVDRTMRETAETFGLSWLRTQREIVLPNAAPQIFVGLRQALATTLILAVVIGMIAGNSGIGFYILQAQQVLNPRAMFAGVLSIAIVGYLLNSVFLLIERRLLHWHASNAPTDAA